MAIPIEKRFVVRAPVARVWEFLTDPYRVAAGLPGAAITEQLDEQTYAGTITVKVGPVASSYKGQVRFERLDLEARVAELTGRGLDVRGRGGADMRMTSRLVERQPNETEVTVTSEVSVTGILAQFGRGMIEDVSDQMFEKFTAAMRAELEGEGGGSDEGGGSTEEGGGGGSAVGSAPAEPAALDAVALGAAVAKGVIGRMMRRPGFWAAVAALAFAIYWLLLR